MNVFHLNLDSTSQVNDLWARFSCNIRANPPPNSFFWSFVPLEKVANLIATEQSLSINNLQGNSQQQQDTQNLEEQGVAFNRKLQRFANFRSETKSNEINYMDLINNSSSPKDMRPLGGILICQAQNEVGKQLEPCLNLLLPPGKFRVRGLKHCSF